MMNTLNTENPIEKPFRKTGDPVDLTSESPLHPRRKSRRIMVGPVPVGGGAPISVQSMTNTLTANVPATLQQIAELTAAGCDIVRVAVPSQDDADALPEICRKSPIPVIADIHFQSKYVFQAIDWPVGSMFQGTVVRLEMETSTPIRIMKMGRLTISRWVLVHGLDRTVRRCSSSCGTCAIVI